MGGALWLWGVPRDWVGRGEFQGSGGSPEIWDRVGLEGSWGLWGCPEALVGGPEALRGTLGTLEGKVGTLGVSGDSGRCSRALG